MKRKKRFVTKLTAGVLSAAMVMSLLPSLAYGATLSNEWKAIGETSSEMVGVLTDGTYTGEAECSHDILESAGGSDNDSWGDYTVTVSVTVEDGTITAVEDKGNTADEENAAYIKDAWEGASVNERGQTVEYESVPGQIISSNSTESIDTVSGATCTSVAIVTAVDAALAGDPDDDGEDDVDVSALEDAIAEAKALTEDGYTAESWAALQEALSEAEKALEAEDKTQESVDNAAKSLTDALDALEEDLGDAEYVYVTMNIPYYKLYGAVAPNAEQADEYNGENADTYATSKYGLADDGNGKRSTSGTSKGSYNNGTCIQGSFYAVKMDQEAYSQLKDSALTEGDNYYFDAATAKEPESYLTLTYSGGTYSFDATTLKAAKTEDAQIESLDYTESYGDYMFDLLNVDNGKTNTDIGTTNIDGEAVTVAGEYLTFSDGSQIALYNVDNYWLGTRYNHQIAWSVVGGNGYRKGHNGSSNPDCYQYTMTDYTLAAIDVITDKGVYTFTCTQELLPYYNGDGEVIVDAADGDAEVAVTVPEEFEDVRVSVYYSVTSGRSSTSVYVAEAAEISDGKVALSEAIDCDANGTYRILVESSNYAPVTVTLDPLMSAGQRETLETLIEIAEIFTEKGVEHSTMTAHVEEARELLDDGEAVYSEADELIGELGGYVLEAADSYMEIADAEIGAMNEEELTLAYWTDLEDARTAVENAAEDRDYGALMEAVTALENLLENPVSAGDAGALSSLIGEAKAALEDDGYTAASRNALEEAIAAAESAISARAGEDELAEAYDTLTKAILSLEKEDAVSTDNTDEMRTRDKKDSENSTDKNSEDGLEEDEGNSLGDTDAAGSRGTVSFSVDTGDSGLSVSADTLAEDLLTDEDRALMMNGSDISFKLIVRNANSTVSDEDKALIEELILSDIGSVSSIYYLDITLMKYVDGVGYAVTETPSPVTVTIDFPDLMTESSSDQNRDYFVMRVHDGAAQIIESSADSEGLSITFATDKFSTYGIASKEKSETSKAWGAKTDDASGLLGLLAMAASSAGVGGFTLNRRRKLRN